MKQITIMSTVFLIILLSTSCAMNRSPNPLDNVESVEAAIKAGTLGSDFAERAIQTGNLYVLELENIGIPYPVFTFSDYQAGYTVLVENQHLVLLCSGFGGGYASNFVIQMENEEQVLTYQFNVGSGLSYTLSGRYVLGTGTATWQNWSDIGPQLIDPAGTTPPP